MLNTIRHYRAFDFVLAASWLIAAYVGSSAEAATVVIDADTVINASNSYPNDRIEIVDGTGGPTEASMEPGGTVRGFTVSGNSQFEINGGTSTYLSGLRENATLTMRGGSIGCTAPGCLVIDYCCLLGLENNSSAHIYGGFIQGVISLSDDSTAHFYGTGLSISSDDRGTFVEGTLANGDAGYFNIGVNPGANLANKVFLHETPEPTSVSLILLATAIAGVSSRGRKFSGRWVGI